MEDPQKLSVLLAEYNTLRAETIWARDNVIKALQIGLPLIGGLLGFAITKPEWMNSLLPLAFFIGVLGALTAWWNDLNTRSFTIRLRAIEKQVNEMAGDKRLLIWETDHGWGSIFPPRGNPFFKGPPVRESEPA